MGIDWYYLFLTTIIYYPLPLLQEFKKAVTDEKGLFLESSSSSGQNPIHQETDETLSITFAVEQ